MGCRAHRWRRYTCTCTPLGGLQTHRVLQEKAEVLPSLQKRRSLLMNNIFCPESDVFGFQQMGKSAKGTLVKANKRQQ